MFEKTTLEGALVRLEPMDEMHKQGLCEAIGDGELWQLFYTLVPHPNDIDSFINTADYIHQNGSGLAFTIFDKKTNKIIGSTRFLNSALDHKRTEIGSTFLAKSAQKTLFNTEAKLLMLTHAFETLTLNRVAFVTDFLNKNSQRAILRLGAKKEGLLRNHMVMPNGRIRDSLFYSVTINEWPSVKQNIAFKLGA